jgi:hypothetical protein
MALARIITRSHQCSRELALDLLARGYAVEIVSPDKIPDNIADLELRVEAGPGDQLIASVEAHDGDRSASLEFLHHLKSPMVDFIRRPPEPSESAHFPGEPVSFNAEPSLEDMESPLEVPQLAQETASPIAENRNDLVSAPVFDFGADFEESARLISPLAESPSLPVETPSDLVADTPPVPPIVESVVTPTWEPQPHARSAGWFWRAALPFGCVVLLALVAGFGLRWIGKASAHNSGAAPQEKVAAAPTDAHLSSAAGSEKSSGQNPGQNPGKDEAKNPGQVVALAAPPPVATSQANSTHVPNELPAVKPRASTASTATGAAQVSRRQVSRGQVSHGHGNDLVARDTVTYLDKSYDKSAKKAKAAKRSVGQHPSSRNSSSKNHTSGIAPDTVTYLDQKPAPKATKQN